MCAVSSVRTAASCAVDNTNAVSVIPRRCAASSSSRFSSALIRASIRCCVAATFRAYGNWRTEAIELASWQPRQAEGRHNRRWQQRPARTASSGGQRDGIRRLFAFCLHAHASRRGGSDPQRACPSTEGAGARIRETRGVAPPSPGTPLLTPDAAELAASLRTSRATKSRRRNDFAGATPASRSVGTHRLWGRQRGRRGAIVLRACRPLNRGSQPL